MECLSYELINYSVKVEGFFQILQALWSPPLKCLYDVQMEHLPQKNCTLVPSVPIENCKVTYWHTSVDAQVLDHLVRVLHAVSLANVSHHPSIEALCLKLEETYSK